MFEIGRRYRRRDLHHAYGGQWQGGISTPSRQPLIFLFTGESGEQYGYRDGWEPDGTFQYTGEGQVGAMRFTRGNAAIRDHAAEGKDLHLFQTVKKGWVRYVGQMVCAGYNLVSGVPDREGNPRTGIVFLLVPHHGLEAHAANERIEGAGLEQSEIQEEEPSGFWARPLADLRVLALEPPPPGLPPLQARRNIYRRSEAVRIYVLRRAHGLCEGCGQPAPFLTPGGRPYLEPHHTRRLSDGGPDHPAWVIALCPSCHRRAHYAEDATAFNASLVARASAVEAGL